MTIKDLIRESLAVMIGVLFALFIGDLKQRYDDGKYLDTMFAAMRMEAKDNLDRINEVIENQEKQMDSIQSYVNDPNINLSDIIIKTGGFQVARVQNTAWKSVVSSRAELVDYQTLSLLNRIDRGNQIVEEKTKRITDHLLANMYSADERDKSKLYLLYLDLLGSEYGLAELHEEFLEEE